MRTADDTGVRNIVVLSSDSDDDAPLVVAPGGKKGKKPSRPVVISSDDDEEDEEVDCVAIAAAEAEGSAQLAASLGALTVGEASSSSNSSAQAAAAAPSPPPLPPVAFGDILLDGAIASKLYPHQLEGISWLSSLASGVAAVAPPSRRGEEEGGASPSRDPSLPPPGRRLFRGGILADEMGLGKTRQVAAFLRGAVDSGLVRRALVVAPKSLLRTWAAELSVVGVEAREFGSGAPAERAAALAAVGPPRGSGVLLTTYGMLLHNSDDLQSGGSAAAGKQQQQQQQQVAAAAAASSSSSSSSSSAAAASLPEDNAWDAVVFDEGHCLKNPKTRLAELARSLDSKMKILLSGTPVRPHPPPPLLPPLFCFPIPLIPFFFNPGATLEKAHSLLSRDPHS